MKKLKKFRKAKLPVDKVKLPLTRPKSDDEKVAEALGNVPRITNETVTEHREEVLSSARKYIYPLQHSKNRVVKISAGLFALFLIIFFATTGLALYKFQGTSGFIHNVTRIIPFPVAKAGDKWVSYEAYLFELRRNMHYYRTQQQADFSTEGGREQLKHLKQQAMSQVVQEAYVKRLAEQNDVRVSNEAVNNQLTLVRSQNRLGNNDRVFRDVLREFWGWSETDFRRALRQQLLKQAVVAKLDTRTQDRAQSTLKQLQGGADFAALAAQVSDDQATRGSGGQYPTPITVNDRNLPPVLTHSLFSLQPNQLSDIINSGYTLEIVKVTEKQPTSVKAAHIQFNLRDINDFVTPLQKKEPSRQYIRF